MIGSHEARWIRDSKRRKLLEAKSKNNHKQKISADRVSQGKGGPCGGFG
jgi:hypothetical protein